MSREVDIVVIGAGVVGLAVAAALARLGRSVVIVERNEDIVRETTSRNSQVIHAGIYYPEGSLKARTCVAGREALYARCDRLGLPHRRTGKLIVAVEEQERAALERLHRLGTANGVPGLEMVDGATVRRLEPSVRACAALLSPQTGIVDAMAYARSFLAEAESHGASLALQSELLAVEPQGDLLRVTVQFGDERQTVTCAGVVNAAGLQSDEVARRAGVDVEARGWTLHPCKGDYFALAPGTSLSLQHLVYPVPSGPGLGIHATVDLQGRILFGPDAEYVPAPRYDVDPAKAESFAVAVRRYLPELESTWLAPDQSGVRPRLAAPGEKFRDFVIAGEAQAGMPGMVHLVGIESPGLTAASAIADDVADLLSAI